MKPNAAPSSPPSAATGSPSRPTPAIPGHEMLRWIGGGSYGEVWLARNVMGTYRAVKLVYRANFNEDRPYEREFEGIRNFEPISHKHPSQVNLLNVDRNDQTGYFYYVMELADDQRSGQRIDPDSYEPKTLRSELNARGCLPVAECLETGITLATALEHLHSEGLIHRDIKPSNVVFVHGRSKLADIGLVAAAGEQCSFVGTEGYVPLEGPGKAPADIFALGKVLYGMLTGLSPERYPSLPEGWAKTPDHHAQELNEVVVKACAANVAERYQSAAELRMDLELLKSGKSLLRMRQLEAWVKKAKWAFAIGIPVVVVIVALVAFGAWRAHVAHLATVAQLEASKLSRMLVRNAGWSARDWQNVERAAAQNLDNAVVREAVSTLAGVDARIVCKWPDVEASSAAFAPDGQALLTGFGTSRAMLIRDSTNRTELPVVGQGKACWNPKGEPLVWQRAGSNFVLREARTGAVRKEFPLAPGEEVAFGITSALAATPDGSFVAAALVWTNGARVVIWDALNGRTLGEANRSVGALSFTPDGSMLAAGDELGKTIVWRTSPFTLVAELPPAKRPNRITCLAFGEDRVVPQAGPGETSHWLLAVGDLGAGIVIWDITKRLPRAFCPGSDYNVQSLTFSPDGLTLASAGRGYMRIWDVMSGAQLLWNGGISGSDTPALAFDSSGNRLVVGANASSSQSSVGLVELEQHRGIKRLRGLNFQVRKVWFSPNSRLVAALSDDWSLAIWETESGRLRHVFEAPAGVLADNAGGAFDATGKRFGFAAGFQARLYDLESGRTLEDWDFPWGLGEEVQFDAQGRFLVVRHQPSPEHSINWPWTLYELPQGRVSAVLHQQADLSYQTISMAFPAPASQFVAITKDRATGLSSVRAFDVVSGGQLWQVEQHRNSAWEILQTSAGGKWCGFGVGTGSMMQFVRMADGALDFTLSEKCLAIGPDGRDYTTPGGGQWIVRSVDESKMPIHFGFDGQEHGDTFRFSPDGRYLGWGTIEGSVFLAEISVVRQRLSSLPHSGKLR